MLFFLSLAMSTMVTEPVLSVAVRAASRREVRAVPTLFLLNNVY
ncbi:MAG: hypothetical protein V7K50_26035 [Nostoc sp.]